MVTWRPQLINAIQEQAEPTGAAAMMAQDEAQRSPGQVYQDSERLQPAAHVSCAVASLLGA